MCLSPYTLSLPPPLSKKKELVKMSSEVQPPIVVGSVRSFFNCAYSQGHFDKILSAQGEQKLPLAWPPRANHRYYLQNKFPVLSKL